MKSCQIGLANAKSFPQTATSSNHMQHHELGIKKGKFEQDIQGYNKQLIYKV